MPEQQLVEIAKAVGTSARVVVMDEPTASLTDREVEHLVSVIARLRASGVGIIYISHRLEEVFAIADRITVLRDGATVTTVARTATTPGEIVHLMVGRALETSFPRRDVALGDVALEVRGLASHDAGLHDISLAVRQGEILALAGLVGSGRTELAEVIFGLRPLDAGQILLGGAAAAIHSPGDAIRLGVAYLPEDRLRHGVVPEMSVAANASLANLDAVSRHGIVDRAAEAAVAREYVERFRIRTPSVGAAVGALSGGNQQKVALARWLATRPAVLIVDEPTQGVDVGSKAEIHGLLQSLRERGLAILMISSELPEVLGMCDRVAVMRAGTIAGVLSRADATEERVLALALAVPAGPGATESAPPW